MPNRNGLCRQSSAGQAGFCVQKRAAIVPDLMRSCTIRTRKKMGERLKRPPDPIVHAGVFWLRVRHGGRFQGEQDEGKRGIAEGGDGRADVTEAGGAREQVHVRGPRNNYRPDGQENDQPNDEDGPIGAGETIVDRNGAADRFQHRKGSAPGARVRVEARHDAILVPSVSRSPACRRPPARPLPERAGAGARCVRRAGPRRSGTCSCQSRRPLPRSQPFPGRAPARAQD